MLHTTRANYNNTVGVPLTLLGLTEQHRYAVIELGTNQKGEVARLTAWTEPDAALLTMIGLEHTEGLGSLQGVADEEGDLFAGLSRSGIAFGNGDDEHVCAQMQRASSARRVTWGEGSSNSTVITSRRVSAEGESHITLKTTAREMQLRVPMLGRAAALATAAAVSVALEVMPDLVNEETTTHGLELGVKALWGRLGLETLNAGTVLINDCYNANPPSMRASIEAATELAHARGTNVTLVLGEMRELGSLAAQEHEALGHVIRALENTRVIAVTGLAQQYVTSVRDGRFYAESTQAARDVALWMRAGDVVLVKGSRGVRTELVAQALRERSKEQQS